MFTTAYAAGTVLGDADSRRAAAFRALASGFLGMDGRRGRIRISLCSSFPNAVPLNRVGRVLRATVARRLCLANRGFQFQKRSQQCICTHNETLSVVPVRVNNPNCSPDGIDRGDAAPAQPDALRLSAIISQYRIGGLRLPEHYAQLLREAEKILSKRWVRDCAE